MKTCLIVGCRGMLGTYLSSYIPSAEGGAEYRISGCDLPAIDITDPSSVAEAMAREKPDLVINCAAYTDVDGAEKNADLALAINGAGPEILARACAISKALLVHISTDFIFDGAHPGPYREEDTPHPLSVYGKTKLAGEIAVAKVSPEHLIIRTAWLYGPNGKNFVDTILRLARERGALTVVDDQAGSPTFTGVLSEYLWRLVRANARGTFHVAGSGVCTWYDLAREAVALSGLNVPTKPVTTADFPRPAHRPRNSSLDCGKAEKLLKTYLPHWREGLRRYLATK
jgi:dTDP-4-dehydrorhamnose reductase